MKTRIISYNVNGIRAAHKKGLYDWLEVASPEILCLQEIKAQPEQLSEEMVKPNAYETFWYPAVKKGYSGVAVFSKLKPNAVVYGCGMEKYDQEGRILRLDFDAFSLMCVYFPSGSSGDERQAFKEVFLEDFYQYISELKQEVPRLVIAGDINIVHKPIDIHDPVGNKNSSGFLPHERAWLTQFLDLGFVDSFRKFHDGPDHYSWWSYRARARENNKGWRIDYQFVSAPLAEQCTGAGILPDVVHSDHCPVSLELTL